MITRRTLLKWGGATSAALLLPHAYRQGRSLAADFTGGFFGYVPFTQPLFIPKTLTRLEGANRLNPRPGAYPRPTSADPARVGSGPSTPRGNFADVAHGIAPEFGHCPDWNRKQSGFSAGNTHEHEFGLFTEETRHQFVPFGPEVPVLTYRDETTPPGSGNIPGPTVVAEYLEPVVLRDSSRLTRDRTTAGHDIETSVHLHGTHAPAHADGFPDFYCLAGEARDFFYPNIAPRKTDPGTLYAPVCSGEYDETWIPSTLWYHDHAMDITGFTVSHGLAGFYLVFDDKQRQLADAGVLPQIGGRDAFDNPLDIGLALQDQRFNADGTLFYDFLDHDGRLGNVFTVNGLVQPKHTVERRKYRFRILNASNARAYELRLSTRRKMSIIGTDTWLLPRAIEVESFQLAQSQRQDVIIDFRGAPDEVYLENILIQEEGRKADKIDRSRPTKLLKFEVKGGNYSETPVVDGTPIRGFKDIDPNGQFAFHREDEIVATRRFAFDRSNGAWTLNNRFFNPRRADAVPELGYGAERWIFENPSGGWWHPVHTHLEGFQIKQINGRLPRRERQFNSDSVALEGEFTAELFIKWRTFAGPFVFHCHALEHEDMRMMGVNDPTPGPHGLGDALDLNPPLDAETRINPLVSGVLPDCEQLEAENRIYFEEVGDTEILAGRGVGESCKFDRTRRGNQSS
jgi:FtsP/CotA-like multicopper oxidase with cupredoxin domain